MHAICGTGGGWILNELCLEFVPQRTPRESDLGNTAVEARLCRATLSSSGHKPVCKRVTARCHGAMKTYAQAP